MVECLTSYAQLKLTLNPGWAAKERGVILFSEEFIIRAGNPVSDKDARKERASERKTKADVPSESTAAARGKLKEPVAGVK